MKVKSNKKNSREKVLNKTTLWCWLFLLPMLCFYILFQLVPIIANTLYSTLNWSGISSNAIFIGLDNYKELLKDKYFWNSLLNSFKYMIMTVPVQLAISLLLAYLLTNTIKKGATVFRTIFFLPVITTTSIVGIVMVFIFGGTGVINELLSNLGIPGINWLGSAKTSLGVISSIGVWKEMGIFMIYWMAALQSVPEDVYDAAKIDGANSWQTFSKIVFPLILPIGKVIGLLCVMSSLKVFDLVQSMTNGGPFYSTDVISTFVYRTAYAGTGGMPRAGYASAAALTFGVIVITMALLGNVIKNKYQKD
ncbi:sugar ABC transporter permease [Clostridium sp.]|uniref:carbohydrate ABC transporter permease n=1 Tax=Clostridium sp. TaxID=1506 RepID=UPI002628C727|nr:sugar ABC transporter permease [Clostridium sp.]